MFLSLVDIIFCSVQLSISLLSDILYGMPSLKLGDKVLRILLVYLDVLQIL